MVGKSGYFSLIQYSEVPERGEFVNLGVVVFSGTPLSAFVRFNTTTERAERLFQVHLDGRYEGQKEALRHRLTSYFWSRDEIARFIALRSGRLRLSPLRSVLIEDPAVVRDDLFTTLVQDATS